MGKRTESLLFKFGVIFGIFTLIMLALSGVSTYVNQTGIYKQQREESIQQIAAYLEDMLAADGESFVQYQRYMEAHFADLNIPLDFDEEELSRSRARFEALFAAEQPGKVLGVDVPFAALSPQAQEAYAIYRHELYLLRFEKARDAFNIIYTYYLVPTGEPLHMWWMLDGVREKKTVDGNPYIDLCTDIPEALEAHRCMWEAWNTGTRPAGYDTYDNDYGKTYAYYTPLFINGQKLGVIGVEVEIAAVNKEILRGTVRQVASIGVILIFCVGLVLWFIYHAYIAKIRRLESNVRDYALQKNADIANDIRKNAHGEDEITSLAQQIAAMIVELENYMKSLFSTAQQLRDSRAYAAAMDELANKDALTGIRNKTAYDKEASQLDWQIADGNAQFGIVMVDLNFLKRINDTFGHEQGNIAIKKLCYIICHVFEHSPVFRIGGDEFVVIVEHDDYANVEALVSACNQQFAALAADETLEQWERVSASVGYALYDAHIDNSVANVFKRADKAMYLRKKEMRAVREV